MELLKRSVPAVTVRFRAAARNTRRVAASEAIRPSGSRFTSRSWHSNTALISEPKARRKACGYRRRRLR
jgi:hypothetical protein